MKYSPSLPASPTSRRSALLSPWITLMITILFCMPTALTAQSVTFAGTQTTLPTSGLGAPFGVAVDNAGDVFIADPDYARVVELPRTATGYGPQTPVPFSNLSIPVGITVDGAGDIFITNETPTAVDIVVELPRTATGYGPQMNLLTSGLVNPLGIAVDSAGDLFVADGENNLGPGGGGPRVGIA